MNACWTPAHVAITMDPDAFQAPPHRFLATHQPMRMIHKVGYRGEGNIIDQERFLEAFLTPQHDLFVPVLGFSGTGKSHLIRWLEARIPSTESRYVLLIPKLKTNLRDVIEIILNTCPDSRLDEYRQRLKTATQDLTLAQAREQLLNRIAEAIGTANHPDLDPNSNEGYLSQGLPKLFLDPYFRDILNQENGIIHRLATHILGHQDKVERLEARRQFTHADFPINLQDFRKASEAARDIYEALAGSEDDLLPAAIDWVNQNLDAAIAKVLNFGGDSLLQLMREVRESLHEKGVELVFLIEDFAKLQGIDRALLEALLARMDQAGENPLCRVRVALACTDGYFGKLDDTVLQRVSFSIWFNFGQVADDSLMSPAERNSLAARYLNAVRLKDDALSNWQKKTMADASKIPNACEGCAQKERCHAAFGSVNGFGLFPFTETALDRMQTRVNQGEFNTRLFIKDLLRPVLDLAEKELPQGNFPSIEVHQQFGAILDPLVRKKIDPKDTRRATLLTLWAPGDRLVDFPEFLHEAFSLPPHGHEIWSVIPQAPEKSAPIAAVSEPAVSATATVSATLPPKTPPQNVTPPLPPQDFALTVEDPPEPAPKSALETNLEELTNWSNFSPENPHTLTQSLREKLGQSVVNAIKEGIDWDGEMLLESQFVSQTDNTPFKRTSVSFSPTGQAPQRLNDIQLNLPMNAEELPATAIALKGLILFEHHGHWNFPRGAEYQREFANQLDRWSEHVLKQVRALGGDLYDPVPAVAEVLAIGARLKGFALNPEDPLPDLADALFQRQAPEGNKGAIRTERWNSLNAEIERQQAELLSILKSRIAATKGGSEQLQIIDFSQLQSPLQDLLSDWNPKAALPQVQTTELRPLVAIRKLLDQEWERLLVAENQRLQDWLEEARADLGEAADVDGLLEALKSAMQAANEAAVFRGSTHDAVTKALDSVTRLPIQAVMRTLSERGSTPSRGELLDLLCHDEIGSVLQNYQEFKQVVSTFLAATTAYADAEQKKLAGDDGQSMETLLNDLGGEISELVTLVSALEGEKA